MSELASLLNLKKKDDFYFGIVNDYHLTLIENSNKVFRIVLNRDISKDNINKISILLNAKVNSLTYSNVIEINIPSMEGEKEASFVIESLKKIKKEGFAPETRCEICKEITNEELISGFYSKIYFSFHKSCIEEKTLFLKSIVEKKRRKIVFGYIISFLLGIIGLLPTSLMFVFTGHVFGIGYMLVPILSMFGFVITNNKLKLSRTIHVVASSFIIMLVVDITTNYLMTRNNYNFVEYLNHFKIKIISEVLVMALSLVLICIMTNILIKKGKQIK